MKRFRNFSRQSQTGFTIIELMVATMAFSVILLAITVGVLHFSNAYYKGVNSSATQDVARSIIDTLAQAVEFSGGSVVSASHQGTFAVPGSGSTVNVTVQTYCIGNKHFDFILGKELGKEIYAPAAGFTLYETTPASGASCTPLTAAPITGGQELLNPNMRLSNLSITSPLGNGIYTIKVRVVYGDSDLLSNPTATNANCLVQTGSQFCAVSELTTTVQSRINP